MSDDAMLQHLLLTLYASVTERETARCLPDLISRWAGGTTAALWITNESRVPVDIPLTNGPTEGAGLYSECYYQYDPWESQFYVDNTGQVVRGSESISDEDLSRSHFYNEFGRRFELFHQMNTTFSILGNGSRLYSTLSVLRAKGAEAFSDAEVGRLQLLVPHLKQALSLQGQIDQKLSVARASALTSFVEALPLAACVVRGDGRLMASNQAADAMRGLKIKVFSAVGHEKIMVLNSLVEQRKFLGLVANAASGLPGGNLLLTDNSSRYIQLTITPLPLPDVCSRGWASSLAFVALRPVGITDPIALARIGMNSLGFTEAEADVAAALAVGKNPHEISHERGTKISTVRTLLMRAQDKAGALNLRQLVGILTSLQA